VPRRCGTLITFVAVGSWLRGNPETEFANRKFVPTSINLKNESAGDGRGDKRIEKTILRTFRALTFSRSQGHVWTYKHAECHHPNAASPSHFASDRLYVIYFALFRS
jgi:hypothetical protein